MDLKEHLLRELEKLYENQPLKTTDSWDDGNWWGKVSAYKGALYVLGCFNEVDDLDCKFNLPLEGEA